MNLKIQKFFHIEMVLVEKLIWNLQTAAYLRERFFISLIPHMQVAERRTFDFRDLGLHTIYMISLSRLMMVLHFQLALLYTGGGGKYPT